MSNSNPTAKFDGEFIMLDTPCDATPCTVQQAMELRDQLDKAIEEARIGSDPFERWWKSLPAFGNSVGPRFIDGMAINRNQAKATWGVAWKAAKEAK